MIVLSPSYLSYSIHYLPKLKFNKVEIRGKNIKKKYSLKYFSVDVVQVFPLDVVIELEAYVLLLVAPLITFSDDAFFRPTSL